MFDKFDGNQLNLNIDNLITSFMNNIQEISNKPQLSELFKEIGTLFVKEWEEIPLFKLINIFINFIRHKNVQDSILQLLQLFTSTTENLFNETELYDKNLFFEIRNKLKKANQIKREYIEEKLIEYSDRNNSFFKVDNVLKSCLLLREFYRTQEDDRNVFSQNKLYAGYFLLADFSHLKIFLESLDQPIFELYIFDLLLKFSYIIESHFRNIIEFLYKLTKFLNGEKIRKNEYKFFKILKFLEQDPGLRHYRNSIFHSKFKIKYHPNFEEIQIYFLKDKKILFKWPIKELFSKIINILQLIRTLDLIMLDSYLSVEDIIESIRDFFIFINSLETDEQETLILQGLEETFGPEKMKMTYKDTMLKTQK